MDRQQEPGRETIELGPADAPWTLLFTHGAGAPMDSPLLTALCSGLADEGVRTVRFEFPYMAARRRQAARRPPDRREVLLATWKNMIRSHRGDRRLAIGGHSMGGRYATLVASEPGIGVDAVVSVGYPFQPADSDQPRIDHLGCVEAPLLIVQGTRDSFGGPDEVAGWKLPKAIHLLWIDGGDHRLVARRGSSRTTKQNLQDAATGIARFLESIG